MYKIKDFKLRYIFNSHADKAIEAEVILQDDSCGRASSPSAITPGKLEKVITNNISVVISICTSGGFFFKNEFCSIFGNIATKAIMYEIGNYNNTYFFWGSSY